jgi:hypothetical protein
MLISLGERVSKREMLIRLGLKGLDTDRSRRQHFLEHIALWTSNVYVLNTQKKKAKVHHH